MTGPHVRDDLGGYVLGALEPAERDAVEAHLAELRRRARAELARLAGLPALLRPAEGLEIPAAPPAVEERLLDRIAQRAWREAAGGGLRARLARRRLALGAHGLAAPRACGARRRAGRRDARRRRHRARVGTGDEAGAPRGRSTRCSSRAPPARGARAELEPGRGGTEVHLWVKGLPPGAEAVYEVSASAPAGARAPARSGPTPRARLRRPHDGGAASGSTSGSGSSAAPTPDADVMTGEIQ